MISLVFLLYKSSNSGIKYSSLANKSISGVLIGKRCFSLLKAEDLITKLDALGEGKEGGVREEGGGEREERGGTEEGGRREGGGEEEAVGGIEEGGGGRVEEGRREEKGGMKE